MEKAPSTPRWERWLDRRVARKGLRPREAAYVLGAAWAGAVVVLGVLEWVVDPKTFHTAWLGIWWGVETVTTVGYGDVIPKQTIGKVMAGFLMLGGLSLISVVTAAITTGFVSRAQAQAQAHQASDDPLMLKLDQLAAQLEEVKDELGKLRSDENYRDSSS